jgi:hypothetical protein
VAEFYLALLGLLVEVLVYGFSESLVGIVVECISETFPHAFRRGRTADPLVAGLWFVILGWLAGIAGAFLLPHRLLPKMSPLPGISLILAPASAGLAMHLFGQWRRRRGGDPTLLATFWGGALFAFAMAAARWLLIGRA